MEIKFTIDYSWVEFLCHFLAAVLYITTGFEAGSRGRDVGLLCLIIAVALTVFAAHL